MKGVYSITMELLAQFPMQGIARGEVTVDFYITAQSSAFKWKLYFYDKLFFLK